MSYLSSTSPSSRRITHCAQFASFRSAFSAARSASFLSEFVKRKAMRATRPSESSLGLRWVSLVDKEVVSS